MSSNLPPKFTAQLSAAREFLERELAAIRTGRASPALVEQLAVDCYGSTSPLQQLASISAPEPQQLLIQPWDPSVVKDIEKAIIKSSLGINPVVDGRSIRLPFPPMTDERRQEVIKVVKERGEQAKIRIRAARDEAQKYLRDEERDGRLSEDQAELSKKELQRLVDEYGAQFETIIAAKIDELKII